MSIKITTEKTLVTDHEISLPFFVMGGCYAYKIVDETTCIGVCYGLPTSLSIGLYSPQLALNFDYGEKECTEEEFNEKYQSVQNQFFKIKQLPC